MKKIVLILLFSFYATLYAQDLQLSVSVNKNPVLIGEQIRIEFSIKIKGENFKGPNFKDFRIQSGPNPSTSSSYTFVNGKSKSETTTTYSYFVKATKVGNLTIGSASLNANGKQYKSKPTTIKVLKNNIQNSQNNSKNKNKKAISANQLYLKASVNKTKIFQGEQILVTYKLFTRIDLASTELSKNPALNGFWTKDIKVNNQFKREIINGMAYNVATVKKALLTAQKSGKLEVDPMEIRTKVRVQKNNRRDPFDPFGMFNQYSTLEEIIKSKSIYIKVEPLPIPKPLDYYGAVGNLKIQTTVDKKSLKANEAINFKIILSGTGNLNLLDPFKVEFPPDFEIYDPKVIEKTFNGKDQTEGKKIFEYLLIPRFEGQYEIPSISYTYFHPPTKKYKTINSEKIAINVLKGEKVETSISNITNKEDIKMIGSDIRYIHNVTELKVSGKYFFKSNLFYILLCIPIFLLLSLLMYLKILAKNEKDTIFQKSRKATKIAQKRLNFAQKHVINNEKELFFEEIEKSLWGYFADKFNVEIAKLSKESIHNYFNEFNIQEITKKQFIALLDDCEIARYAPSQVQNTKMEEILKAASKIIIDVESQKK